VALPLPGQSTRETGEEMVMGLSYITGWVGYTRIGYSSS